MEEQIALEYHGSMVDMGRMDAYQTAANILAFSDYLGVIAKTAFGEKAILRSEIQGLRGESFDIDFALTIAGAISTALFSTGSPRDLIDITIESLKAWIHLNGKPPESISQSQNSNEFAVRNNVGEITYVRADVINVITDRRAGEAVQQFLGKPLSEGIDHIGIRSLTSGKEAVVDKEHAGAFVPIEIEKPLLENEAIVGLVIESPVFKEGNKWKFSDGQASFYAEVRDEEFMTRVENGLERFGKGDVLIVNLLTIQKQVPTGLKAERVVLEVREHREAGQQMSML